MTAPTLSAWIARIGFETSVGWGPGWLTPVLTVTVRNNSATVVTVSYEAEAFDIIAGEEHIWWVIGSGPILPGQTADLSLPNTGWAPFRPGAPVRFQLTVNGLTATDELREAALGVDTPGEATERPLEPRQVSVGNNFFDWIRDVLILATNTLVNLAVDCYHNPIFVWLGPVFAGLSTATSNAAGYLYDASSWYNEVTNRINAVLSFEAIRALILGWLPDLPGMVSWFADRADNLLAIVNNWWAGTRDLVFGWSQAVRDDVLVWLRDYVSLGYLGEVWESLTLIILSWIDTGMELVRDTIDTIVSPVRDEVNRHTAVLALLTDPGDAALRWLAERIELMIARLW